MSGGVYLGTLYVDGKKVHSVYTSGMGLARRDLFSWARINGYELRRCRIAVRKVFK